MSDRDFAIESGRRRRLSVHLSRLPRNWCFGVPINSATRALATISPRFLHHAAETQPDAAELIRAKTGRVIGDEPADRHEGTAARQQDMQEDKEPVFDCADTLSLSVAAMTDMLKGRSSTPGAWPPTREGIRHGDGSRGLAGSRLESALRSPSCHRRLGCDGRGPGGLADLSLADMRSVESAITEDIFGALGVRARSTVGQVMAAPRPPMREQASKPAALPRAQLGIVRVTTMKRRLFLKFLAVFALGGLTAACGRKYRGTRKAPVIPNISPQSGEAVKTTKTTSETGRDSWTISTTGQSSPRRGGRPSDIAEAVGAAYVYSTATIEKHYKGFADALADMDATVCFAVKAYSNIAVIKTLADPAPAPTWFRAGIVPRLDGGDARGQDRFFRRH